MCCTRPSSFGYTAGFGTAADACNQPVVGLHRTCSSAALDKVYKRLFGIFSEKYGTGSQENLSACRLSAVPLFLPYGSQNATVSIIPEDSSRVKGKPQFSQRISMEKSGEMAECKMWQAKHVEIQRISRKVKSFLTLRLEKCYNKSMFFGRKSRKGAYLCYRISKSHSRLK